MTSRMLTVLCFGTLAPILLMLAPVVAYLNLRAEEWINNHSEQRQFGEVLAEQILVQTPISIFCNLGFAISLGLAIFVFLDLVTQQALGSLMSDLYEFRSSKSDRFASFSLMSWLAHL